jgi:hypothetical protein
MSNHLTYHAGMARNEELRRQAAASRHAAAVRAPVRTRNAWSRLEQRLHLRPRLSRLQQFQP